MSYKIPITDTNSFGAMKIGDGLSVSDGVVSAMNFSSNYGFFTSGTQTNPVGNAININSMTASGPINGLHLVSNNTVVVETAGVYSVTYTANINKTAGGTSSISMWLKYNAVDVPDSRQELYLINTLSNVFATGTYLLDMEEDSNLQLCWSSSDTTVSLARLPVVTTPKRPSGSSVKLTVLKIS